MKVSKLVRLLGLSLIVLALSAGVVTAQDGPKVLHTGIGMVGGDLNTIDPAVSEVAGEHQITTLLWPGVTVQDEETGEVVPGIATDWEVSEDGLTYTYNLVQEIPWVRYNAETGEVEQVLDEDGTPRYVTAHDIVYGWRRTLDPETASPYAYVLQVVVQNGAEVAAGELPPEELGIVAVDDYTVQITLPEPLGFAPGIHGLWMATAQPAWSIEEGGDLWTEPEYISTYGSFALKEWAHDESITLIKNPFWPGTEHIQPAILDEVVFHFLDQQTQFAEFLAGTLDAIDVPLEELERVQTDPELSQMYSSGARMCTYYLGFDNTEYPVNNANLRRALSLAIDRVSLVENVTRGGQIPAQWFSRPGLNAAPTLETHPDLGIWYDPEAAQESLQAALDELGLSSIDELPPLTLSFNAQSGHEAIMQAIQQMWRDELGLDVQLNAMDSTTYFSVVSQDAPMIWRTGWCQDYPDANNFLYDVLHSKSTQNDPGFSNAEYDALVERARVSTDPDERLELYAQAEEILVDQEAAIAPIYWYTTNQLTRPYVERTYSIIGDQAYNEWDIHRDE